MIEDIQGNVKDYMAEKQQKKKQKKSKAAEVQKSERIPSGWNTTDEDEARRRCLRAADEPGGHAHAL